MAQIVATIGSRSQQPRILDAMVKRGMSIARFNFAWGSFEERIRQIQIIRKLEKKYRRKIPIIVDVPGPRIQKKVGHTYNSRTISSLTKRDEKYIRFGIENHVEYIAISFVATKNDVEKCRQLIKKAGGAQRIIAKIERRTAILHLDEIIKAADAIMIGRGDLGKEIPLEKIPFLQRDIIEKCKKAGTPVITATEMLFSMTDKPYPTRAEVTDVATAILQGSDAVMLSEETARGKHPVAAVDMMQKVLKEARQHLRKGARMNPL